MLIIYILAHRINSHEMFMVVTEVRFSLYDDEMWEISGELMKFDKLNRLTSFISRLPFSLFSSLSSVYSRK